MVALLVGIGLVSLIVISMYAVVIAVWSAKVRTRYASAFPASPRRETSLVVASTKSVVSQPFGSRRVASDAMR
ncbi:hypothetical protein [Nocardia nova]|uniref:hypothetical protein n=1 Tax=Nocardia nova TaxID=37330 RepID=UPI0033F31D89